MAISITTISSGAELTPASLNDVFEKVQEYINGEMESSDFDSGSAWVDSIHVIRPNFFGSPSPRVEMVSSDVHYREQFDKTYSFVLSNDFVKQAIPIPGLSASIYCSEAIGYAFFHCNFFCFDSFMKRGFGNVPLADSAIGDMSDNEIETLLSAQFSLFVNGTEQEGTKRDLYWNYGNLAVKNHSISAYVPLTRGMNDFSIRVKPFPDKDTTTVASGRNNHFYQIFVQNRNLVIDVSYK